MRNMLSLNDYQIKCLETAVYPREALFYYPALGLVGEMLEVHEQIHFGTDERAFEEYGDVLWYIASMAHELSRPLQDVFDDSLEVPEGMACIDYFNRALTHAGRLLEHAKKHIRDDRSVITDVRKAQMCLHLGTSLRYFCTYLDSMGTSLDAVMEHNIEKIARRKAKKALHGEGLR